MAKKLISLDKDTKDRLEILASLDGRKLKPYIEMRLKKISYETNDLVSEKWMPKNQANVTEKTFNHENH